MFYLLGLGQGFGCLNQWRWLPALTILRQRTDVSPKINHTSNTFCGCLPRLFDNARELTQASNHYLWRLTHRFPSNTALFKAVVALDDFCSFSCFVSMMTRVRKSVKATSLTETFTTDSGQNISLNGYSLSESEGWQALKCWDKSIRVLHQPASVRLNSVF